MDKNHFWEWIPVKKIMSKLFKKRIKLESLRDH
jgi:hypothetical protein